MTTSASEPNDHATTGRELLAAVEIETLAPAQRIAVAQVHALLGVVQSLERVADEVRWST